MEDKVRVYEIAEEAGASSAEVISKAADLGLTIKSAQTTVSFEDAEEITNYILTGKSKLLKKKAPAKKSVKKTTQPKSDKKDEKVAKDEKKSTTTKSKTQTSSKSEPKKEEVQKKQTLKRNELKIVSKKQPAKQEEKPAEKTIKKDIEQPITEETKEDIKPTKTSSATQQDEVKTDQKVKLDKPEVNSKNPDKIVLKKRGLTIVKKKRPVISHPTGDTASSKKQAMKSMSELFGNNLDDKPTYTPKSKKQIKKSLPRAQQQGKKLDVETSADFTNVGESLLGEEIVLHDMNLMETSKFLQDEPKKKQNNQIRTTRPSAFGNRPRGLKRGKKKKSYKRTVEVEKITDVTIPEDCRVYEFAEKIGVSTGDVIGKLFMLGMMVTKNDFLGNDEIEILGDEYDINITIKDELEEVNYEDAYEEVVDKSNYVTRPPVVTIMGHVDHGKTSLLDKIRKSRIAQGEAGGITQHIGAYTVNKNGKDITFVDTPGHEAFKAMRVRGASVTDIIIIVVAADDGVKPQTIESIKAAKESGAPIIVAVNKMDKESANIDMVKAGMAEHEMTPADWGGDVEFIPVSAQTGMGIEDLLENILLQAEILELEADPTALCKATIIEASTQKGRGPVATVIVQNGTLKVGDSVVADTTFGKIKAIMNDQGKPVKELGLSFTGQIVGLSEVPTTGVALVAQNSINEAKEIATTRAEHARAKELSKSTKVSLDEMAGLIAEGKIKALPVIIKADAGGSLEAIKSSLETIKNDEVKVKILSSGVGGITEADLALAGASDNCIILGFNVRPTGVVKTKAKAEGIEIKTYSIIYQLIDDIKDILSGMMSSIIIEENTGQAEVRDTFVVPKVGTVAGCIVTDGKVIRGGLARIIRDGVIKYTGKISSLKRFKDDVKEVANGYECGIMFEKFNDIQVGDYIETFIEHKENQTID
jgi:translation initiation factor IF-2